MLREPSRRQNCVKYEGNPSTLSPGTGPQFVMQMRFLYASGNPDSSDHFALFYAIVT